MAGLKAGPSGQFGHVLDAYESSMQCATRYVYIENQYFHFEELVEHFKEVAQKRNALKCHEHDEPLYYFVGGAGHR